MGKVATSPREAASKPAISWADALDRALDDPGTLSAAYRAFHRFSIGNAVLAAIQLGDRIGPLATFGGWLTKGRAVRKGERAISLYMPAIVGVKKAAKKGDDDAEDAGDAGSATQRRIFLLRAHWFSLYQTDPIAGKEQVEVEVTEPPAWDAEAALAALGITKEPFASVNGGMQGYAIPGDQRVAVSPLAAFPHKTLFHEVAHCVLGHGEVEPDGLVLGRGVQEAEAESVAYLLCATLGMDSESASSSRAYIQDWLGEQEAKDRFRDKHAARVFAATQRILKAGQPEAAQEGGGA